MTFDYAQHCGNWGYMLIGTAAATPCFALPALLQPKADAGKPWHQKYWVKVRQERSAKLRAVC
jgi:cycloeucalenol cycloisomerase